MAYVSTCVFQCSTSTWVLHHLTIEPLQTHHLTIEQMQTRIDVCIWWKERYHRDPNFLSRVATGDETWAYHYDPCTKQETLVYRHSNSPEKKENSTGKIDGKNYGDRVF